MIRFCQQLGCYIGIPLIPGNDILAPEDLRLFVSGREGPDSNTDTHEFDNFRNSTRQPELPSAPSADHVSQSPPSNSPSGGVGQSIGVTLQDAHHSSDSENTGIVPIRQQGVNSGGMEHIDPELHADRSTTRIAEQGQVTMFQHAQHLNFSGNARIMNIGHQHVNNHGNYSAYSNASARMSSNVRFKSSQGLDNLKEFVSFNAFHDSAAQDPERCCPGSRRKVLRKMRTWMDDPNAPERILWLHGSTGVGKSTVTQTISSLYGRDKVGATFFFSRSDPMRNDGNRLFPSLAWRLASSVPVVKDGIAFSLEEDPDLPRKAIEAQFNKLITQPFLTTSGGVSTKPILSRVIIIDGLDECSNENLQRRILKVIGNAVANTRFPLRFIISSRLEAHIEDFFSQFNHPTLQICLASLDEDYRDVDTYLTSEFARIAFEQGLDPEVWPGQDIIDTLVSNSLGPCINDTLVPNSPEECISGTSGSNSPGPSIYAFTVIKYVGDEHESAVARLHVILGLKPSAGQSELDSLYTEILQRQPDQNFLREVLALLVAYSGLCYLEDCATFFGLEETQLNRKLGGMCSVVAYPVLHVYHKSFLDFLEDSSRSGEYHISKHVANRRYMQRITDVLVKAAEKVMEQPDSHGSDHFQPRFAKIVQQFPLEPGLPLNDLEEILQPLLVIQEKLLQAPYMSVPWKPRTCDKCWTFYIIDDLLLHLACIWGSTQPQELKYARIRPLTAMEESQDIPQLDLDTCLSLLLPELRSGELSLSVDVIGLVRALIRFDPTETAMKVRSITDAQNLVKLLFCLNKKECFKSWFGAAAASATRLALAIYGRVPVLPRSLFLNSADFDINQMTYQGKIVRINQMTYQGKNVHMWHPGFFLWRECLSAFIWGSLSQGTVTPLLGMLGISSSPLDMVKVSPPENITLREWRRNTNPSVSKMQTTLFEVAKVIQYIHSLGVVLGYSFDADDVYFDTDNLVKLQCPAFQPNDLCNEQFDHDGIGRASTWENNIRSFGFLSYQVLFNHKVYDTPAIRPREPEIPDNAWRLIQRCCAEFPKERPTIDQVVREMESWIVLGQFTLST